MKAQYVGDIGDFGKVLLLKLLAASGFKIGANWILTANDERSDGKHRDYAENKGKDCLCCCNQEIYEAILPLARKGEKDQRAITDLEALIRRFTPNAVFFDEMFGAGADRADLDRRARHKLAPEFCNLVFFDPDNGISNDGGTSPKHVYCSELLEYWKRGQSILIYHHLNREKQTEEEKSSHQTQIDRTTRMLESRFTNAKIDSFRMRRGTARVYFLCVQPVHQPKRKQLDLSSIQPLLHLKGEWRKRARICSRIH
jgi:hypothetical protein